MDPLKQAFERVKQDLLELNEQIANTKRNSLENRNRLIEFGEIVSTITGQNKELFESSKRTEERFIHYNLVLEELVTTLKLISNKINSIKTRGSSTEKEEITTTKTDIPTEEGSFKPQKGQITPLSIGNGGVPTDRQTDRQTDQQIDKSSHNQEIFKREPKKENSKNAVENAAEILDSLDALKKEIRLKFKRLTEQELLVFSTIYQLEEQEGQVDYKSIAKRLNLTESSIRDYVGRLIKKGIPVDKTKINNKSISLAISSNLKKIAPLSTILRLREI